MIALVLGCQASRPVPTLPPVAEPEVSGLADVVAVGTSGENGQILLSVALSSPDTGCEQYADWWEVLSEDGDLLYRRILGHSHVDEQPFVRSGVPIDIDSDTPVWVRGHMNPGGYGGTAWFGTVASGFTPEPLSEDWDALESMAPTPDGCAF